MSNETKNLLYRADRLPVIYPYHLRSSNRLHTGDLVYYGPCPTFYGIGEIVGIADNYCVVDFRGTGELGIFKEVLEMKYVIPIHQLQLSHLLTER